MHQSARRASTEYEEQLYLAVDGSATVVVDASLPALVRAARRERSIPHRTDPPIVQPFAGCMRARAARSTVSRLWDRRGRRFVQIQVSANDIRTLLKCALLCLVGVFAGADIRMTRQRLKYLPDLGPPAGTDPGAVNWDGSELVAFKVHAPSRIRFHNVKKLDGTDGAHERGNILTWEQTLADRRAGRPLTMESAWRRRRFCTRRSGCSAGHSPPRCSCSSR